MILHGKRRFAFLSSPTLCGATYDHHLRLIRKRLEDFLSVLIEPFWQVLTLRRYERISTENRRFRSNGVSLTQNFR